MNLPEACDSGGHDTAGARAQATSTLPANKSTRTQYEQSARHHSAELRGLDAATTYRYRVGSDSAGWSSWYTFTTATAGLSPYSFLYFGDAQNGLGDVWPEVAQRAYDHSPDAVLSLHAGDMINNANDNTEWAQWFAAQGDDVRNRNVITTPGNHEYKGDDNIEQYRAHFEYPLNGPEGRYEDVWYTDYQGVRFVSLNANVIVGIDQMLWMWQVLENNPNKWTVVTFHQPLFSGSTGRDNPGIRLLWTPILEHFNVDLVLQGHDHVYARGHKNDRINADGTHSGPVYAVSVSGSKSYDLAPFDDNIWTWSGATRQVAAQQMSTFQRIEVEQDRLVYRSYVGRLGLEPQPGTIKVGDLLDGFTITKGANGKKVVSNEVPDEVSNTPIPGKPFDIIGAITK